MPRVCFHIVVFVATSADTAPVPPRIASQRSIAFGSYFGLCLGASFFAFVYFLPIWFQAIKGVSATQSGIDNLALLLSQVVGSTCLLVAPCFHIY